MTTPKTKRLSKKALYESFVGKKYVYENTTYAVGRVLPAKSFATVSVDDLGYAEHYATFECADFVKGAALAEGGPPGKCEGMGCDNVTPYRTEFDGSDLCPACLLTMATETCEECGDLDDHESAAFVGDHILCRDCYNMKDDDELEQLKSAGEWSGE